MASNRGTVRRHARIHAPASALWDLVGDPARVQEWFIGIDSSTVDGTSRTIVTGSGIPMPEEIVTVDPLQRRFQYRITTPLIRDHLSTIDVIDLEDGTCLVIYAADSDPATMALVIAGAAGNALDHLQARFEDGVEAPEGAR